MKPAIYDAGVLIKADRNVRRVWAEHRVRLEAGMVPVVPTTVVAQVSRSAKQVGLRRLLRGCELVGLDEAAAHAIGGLLGRARTTDVVDGSVVAVASERGADIVSDDVDDMERLLTAAGHRARVIVP